MGTSRIELFKQMLTGDPGNTAIMFGLAKEYEKSGQNEELIETLNRYLEVSDDQGNAYGMLASAYERLGQRDQARQAYEKGIETAQRHGSLCANRKRNPLKLWSSNRWLPNPRPPRVQPLLKFPSQPRSPVQYQCKQSNGLLLNRRVNSYRTAEYSSRCTALCMRRGESTIKRFN